MPPLPILPDFLEEHLWALRDRAETLDAIPLGRCTRARLAAVVDELNKAALVLRGQIRRNRHSLAFVVEGMRNILETIERDAWPDGLPR